MAEKKFEKEIKGVKLTGKLDRLDRNPQLQNAVCVIDYKTGATAKSVEDLSQDLQMPAYLKLMEDHFAPDTKRCYAFVSFSADKKQEQVYTPMLLTPDKEAFFEQTLANIQQSDFHNIFPHKNCKYCQYRTVCELSVAERITKIEEIIGCRD